MRATVSLSWKYVHSVHSLVSRDSTLNICNSEQYQLNDWLTADGCKMEASKKSLKNEKTAWACLMICFNCHRQTPDHGLIRFYLSQYLWKLSIPKAIDNFVYSMNWLHFDWSLEDCAFFVAHFSRNSTRSYSNGRKTTKNEQKTVSQNENKSEKFFFFVLLCFLCVSHLPLSKLFCVFFFFLYINFIASSFFSSNLYLFGFVVVIMSLIHSSLRIYFNLKNG